MLWTLEGSFREKLETAAAAGFSSVGLVSEHARWSREEKARALRTLPALGLTIQMISATPNWRTAPISMVEPGQRPNLLDEVERNVRIAKELDVSMLLLMSGDEVPGTPRNVQYDALVESCKRCAEIAARASMTLVIEPLNGKIDHPGYFLRDCIEGLRLVRDVGDRHLMLLFDLYHQEVECGEVVPTLVSAAQHVRIIHVADAPGRHEPGTGAMNYQAIYQALREARYGGDITFEYLPTQDPIASLTRALVELRAALT
jgi:hydroxypyruvate isomerase